MKFFQRFFALLPLTIASFAATQERFEDEMGTAMSCQTPYNFNIWFEPMAVRPHQSNLEFAETNVQVSTTSVNEFDYYIKPSFKFGYRLGIEGKSLDHPWTVGAEYTSFENSSKNAIKLRGTGFSGTEILPKLGIQFGHIIHLDATTDVGQVSTRLKYNYDLLDGVVGYSFCPTGDFQLTLLGGVRALWYTTKVFETSYDSTGVAYSPLGDTSKAMNVYTGVGVVGGLRLKYSLVSHLNMRGFFLGSMITGNNDVTIRFLSTSQDNPTIRKQKETINLPQTSLQGGLYLTWDQPCSWCYLQIGGGFDVTYWTSVLPQPFRMNNSLPGSASVVSKGLFIQNLVGKIALMF